MCALQALMFRMTLLYQALYSVQTVHFTFMQPCYFMPFFSSTCYVNLASTRVSKRGVCLNIRAVFHGRGNLDGIFINVVQHGGLVSSMLNKLPTHIISQTQPLM